MSLKKGRKLFFQKWSWIAFVLWGGMAGTAHADHEWITVPVVVVDYYGWAYTEAFMDKAQAYAWSTAGVDALGWTLLITAGDYDAGLKLVNLAGWAKTIYPIATLLGATNTDIRRRAWIALGTHAATLISLELLGRPALRVEALGPREDAYGVSLAFRF